MLCDVYLELWKDVIAGASPEFCLRLAHVCEMWFLGCLQEVVNRQMRTVPSSIDHYIQTRRGSSAVNATVVIIDFIYGLQTPDTWYYTPELQRVIEALNDVISWHNDLWSFKREVLVEKDSSNMVLANSVHCKISYTEAAEKTVQMIYGRISDLEQAAKEVEAITPPEYRRHFELYMSVCRNSGTHDWHSNSVRYLQ